MDNPHDTPPVNPLPPVVMIITLALILPEIAFLAGSKGIIGGPEAVGWRLASAQRFGFSGDIFDWMIANGRWLPDQIIRVVTYLFVHQGFTACLFTIVLTLALGKMVGEVMGQLAVVVQFFGGGMFGALVYALLLNDPEWLLGAFPAVFGLIGGYSFVMWVRLGAAGENQTRAFSLIAMLMALQLIWGVLFGASYGWVADLAGFAFGFACSALFVPGGMARLMRALRRD